MSSPLPLEKFDTPALHDLPQILLREKQSRKIQAHTSDLYRQAVNELKTYYVTFKKYERELTNTTYRQNTDEYKEIYELKNHFKRMTRQAVNNLHYYQCHRNEVLKNICVECRGVLEAVPSTIIEYLSGEEQHRLKDMCKALEVQLKQKSAHLQLQTPIFCSTENKPNRQFTLVSVVFVEDRVLQDLFVPDGFSATDRLYLKNVHLYIPKRKALEGEKCGYLRILSDEHI